MRAATGFEPSDKWFGQQAVYRISMGNFVSAGALYNTPLLCPCAENSSFETLGSLCVAQSHQSKGP